MNFPSHVFLKDIDHGHRAAILNKHFCGYFRFIWLWLLISIMKRCAERCTLQLYHNSLTGNGKIERFLEIFPSNWY